MTIPQAILALSRSPELSLLLKATVLVGLALFALRMAARSKASVRHLILASTFAALSALPLVIAAARGVRVNITVAPSSGEQAVAAAPAKSIDVRSIVPPEAAPAWTIPSGLAIARMLW